MDINHKVFYRSTMRFVYDPKLFAEIHTIQTLRAYDTQVKKNVLVNLYMGSF